MCAAISNSFAASTNFPSFSSIWPSRLCSSPVFFCCTRVCTSCLAWAKPAGEQISLGQIVAIVVGRRSDALRLFEKRDCVGDLSGLDVELAQVVVGVVVVRLQFERFAELLPG